MACCPTEEKYGYDDSRFEKAVDGHFHCSICYNVLKEPMMCRNNEHIFCRGCITEHLNVNSHTCPECNEDLTIETLRRAPRVLNNYLSELKIKCEYSNRGCQEYIRIEELDSHVENCGFAPVKCSNEECGIVVNKHELIHHESTVCEYRKVKCHNCVKIEHDVERMNEKIEAIKERVEGMAVGIDEVKGLIVCLSSAINGASNSSMQDILVAGGWNSERKALKSVEKFSWKKNIWERMAPMKFGRKGATSFVYENQLFITGGCDSCIIEILNLNEDPLQCDKFTTKLLYHGEFCSVIYKDRAILFCVCGKNDYCLELGLVSPYTCERLCKIPEPARKHYTVIAFEHKVLIFGGVRMSAGHDPLDSVLEFDLNTNELKAMPSLPFCGSNIAVVRWGHQAVLIGGFRNGAFKKVFMYHSKTGNTIELPSLLEERSACAAVITGNTIAVMGGIGWLGRLRSVEAFTLGGNSWRYLPDMNDIRSVPTACVLPAENFH